MYCGIHSTSPRWTRHLRSRLDMVGWPRCPTSFNLESSSNAGDVPLKLSRASMKGPPAPRPASRPAASSVGPEGGHAKGTHQPSVRPAVRRRLGRRHVPVYRPGTGRQPAPALHGTSPDGGLCRAMWDRAAATQPSGPMRAMYGGGLRTSFLDATNYRSPFARGCAWGAGSAAPPIRHPGRPSLQL